MFFSSNVAYCHVESLENIVDTSHECSCSLMLDDFLTTPNYPLVSDNFPRAQTKHLPEGRLAMRKTIVIEGGIIFIIDNKHCQRHNGPED